MSGSALKVEMPISGPAARDSDRRWFGLMVVAWSVPVGLTLMGAPAEAVTATAFFAALASAVGVLLKPRVALFALPFFALLSPVAGFVQVAGTRLLLSDLLFVLLGAQCLNLLANKRVRIAEAGPTSLPAIVAMLFLLSTIMGQLLGTLVSPKPVLFLLQLCILYLYTRTFAAEERTRSTILDAWLVASMLAALLLIHAYLSGKTLIGFEQDLDSGAAVIDREDLSFLFRASYYYAGFHFIAGASIVMLIARLVVSKSSRIVTVCALMVMTLALLLMMVKTAMLAVVLAAAAMLVVVAGMNWVKIGKAFAILLVLLGITYLFVSAALLDSLGESQAMLWSDRVFAVSSFSTRTEVYVQALGQWLSSPMQILIGAGPDFLDNSGDVRISQIYKMSNVTGAAEGTVDSGWMSFLIEFGVVGFAALVVWFVRSLFAPLAYLRRCAGARKYDTSATLVFAGLAFMAIALFTQMLGYSKVTWFPFQLMVMGFMYTGADKAPGLARAAEATAA
jgi:hypothetical protein